MEDSKQFEYFDVLYGFKGCPEEPKFVTILDEFEHHYTGTKFYRVRIEYCSYITNCPVVKYETWTEDEMLRRFNKQEKE